MPEKPFVSEVMVCPECGADMTHLDPFAHSLAHYPEHLDPAKSSKEARANQKLIQAGGIPTTAYQAAKEKEG